MAFTQKLLLWIFVVMCCSLLIKYMLILDSNKQVFGHVPGLCRYVEGVIRGAEDIELILPDGIALITSGLRLVNNSQTAKFKGRVYVYEWQTARFALLRGDPPKAFKVTIQPGSDKQFDLSTFNPYGISSFVSKGRINVYIINRAYDGDKVECFVYQKDKRTLVHSKTIKNDLIYAASDLVAVGADKFYIINSHYFRNGWKNYVEMLLLLNTGNLVYYDGRATVVDKWLHTPIGIATDKNKKHIYVSMAVQEAVRMYNISLDQTVTKHVDISLMTIPDNIFVDPETGELWIGAHPVLHQLLAHISAPKTTYSPSQVIHVRLQDGMDRWVVAQTFADDGQLLNASSVVVRHQNQLLIGSISNRLLLCDLMREDFQT